MAKIHLEELEEILYQAKREASLGDRKAIEDLPEIEKMYLEGKSMVDDLASKIGPPC